MKNLNKRSIYLLGSFFVSMAMGNNFGDITLGSELVPANKETLSAFFEECKNRAFYGIECDTDGEETYREIQNSSIWGEEDDGSERMEIIRETHDAQKVIEVILNHRERYGTDLVEIVKNFQNLDIDFANAVLIVAMILGDNAIINEILSLGYIFDWQNGDILGFSPLHYAVFLENRDYISLIEKASMGNIEE